MSTLRIASYTMPSAGLGCPSPLPPLKPYISASTAGFDEEYALPYSVQDAYDRTRKPVVHKVAILENDQLRATFLLDLGGRLWSLFHKPTQTELLSTNPVFQSANLAIRNAWFSGGVEWNIAKFGHSVFTCSPVHAAHIEGPDGEPILRLYEYERSRDIPFQIDFYLPEGSDFLFSSPRVVNPHDHAIKMYWWTNIAVPQTDQTRVIAPADEALGHHYTSAGIREKTDISDPYYTYPTRRTHAADMYFYIPEGQRPWVTAVDQEGKGLVHISSPQLFGRKMFVWGVEVGGQRWQEFLSEPGQAYIEIQGGLARTQAEYVDMPANAIWSWTEAFGPLEIDPQKAHGEWKAAYAEANRYVNKHLTDEVFNKATALLQSVSLTSPFELLHLGSGWGWIEGQRRLKSNEPTLDIAPQLFSPASIDELTSPWLSLLNDGYLPKTCTLDAPGDTVSSANWLRLLKSSTTGPEGNHWLTWYHIGVAQVAQGQDDEAMYAWEKSLSCEPNPWACRNLAVLHESMGQIDEACKLMLKAIELLPSEKALLVEASLLFVTHKKTEELNKLVERIPEQLRHLPRIRITLAFAALNQGRIDEVERFFLEPIELVDLREGEESITDLWFGLQALKIASSEGVPVTDQHQERARAECPPPEKIDFRMHN